MLRTGLFPGFIVACLSWSATTGAAESIEVSLGGALPVPLRQAAHQVVIGNPAIADVTVQSARNLTLFGKYPGGTTLMVLDAGGNLILDAVVVVTAGSSEAVTVRYGTSKTWVPGGTSAVVECGRDRCSPAMALPTDTPYKSGAAPAPAASPAAAAAAK